MPPLADSVGEATRARLDGVIHSPVRLSVVAAPAAKSGAEFAAGCYAVQITDSALSRAETAGCVQVRRGYVGKRPRTWLKLTPAGDRLRMRARQDECRSPVGANRSVDEQRRHPAGGWRLWHGRARRWHDPAEKP